MNDLVHIGNSDIAVKEYNGQRVVTFKDVDLVHERPDGTAGRNFRDNKKHFIEGEDYFVLNQPDEIRRLGFERPQGGVPEKVILLTEQGYLMVVKSLKDDLAWKVQRQLVKKYFSTQQKPLTQQEMMRIQLGMIDDHEVRLENLENNMNIDYAQQKQLKELVSKVVTNALGGRKSRAYHYRRDDGSKISSQCFSRLWHDFYDYFNVNAYANLPRVKFDEALEYINRWQPPTNMQLEIGRINRKEDEE